MDVIIEPGNLQGTLTPPPSKSLSQRALAAGLLCGRPSLISGLGDSKDECAALNIIEALGADIEVYPEGCKIRPPLPGKATRLRIFCGESGLSARMFTPLAALRAREAEILGAGSLLNRPMRFFEEVLPQLGLTVHSNDGRLPLQIKGDFRPESIEIDGSASSQYLTGLLFAFSAAGAQGTSIQVRHLNSRPYVQLSLDVLSAFGMPVPVWDAEDRFHFTAPKEDRESGLIRYRVPGDWSGAAFFLVAAALFGQIAITGLDPASPQADRAILQALLDSGAAVSQKGTELVVTRTAQLNAFTFDATHCPDLFPPLVTLAAYCQGVSEIKGAGRLIHKESNRADTLSSEFRKLGVQIEQSGDLMRITGGVVQGGSVSAHGDHRIAMACAIAGLGALGAVRISGAEAVEKSYTRFFEDLQQLGGAVQYI